MIESLFDNPEAWFQGPLIVAFIAAYAGGILTSFTPCVYPVIPITVAYIGARGASSRRRAFILSLVYVLGMALVYTFLGAVAALTGSLFGQMQSSPWVQFIIANICIIMALSMLGVFTFSLPVPAAFTRSLPEGKRGGMAGSFAVGALSGLIVGPCTTPVLAVLLSLIAVGRQVALGMGLMFVFALGMGTLLIGLGTFAGLLAGIPKSGLWMTRINRIFGFIMLGIGEYFLIRAGTFWI